jgi:hypothetical protein
VRLHLSTGAANEETPRRWKNQMLTYGEAEAALAAIYKATGKAQAGAFRGRLKHLKRLGIPLGVNPGRGSKILYGESELYQWCFCLELAEFGIDPSMIVKIVKRYWKSHYFNSFKEISEDLKAPDIYFCFVPEFLSATWGPAREFRGLEGTIGFFQRGKDIDALLDKISKNGQRLSLFNISDRLRALDKALLGDKTENRQ